MVLTDATDGKKLVRLVRRMAVHSPVPNRYWPGYRSMPLLRIIEDPHPKDSQDSYFIQACDSCAYFALQAFKPNSFIRRAGAHNYIGRLSPVLNRHASASHPFGIVVL